MNIHIIGLNHPQMSQLAALLQRSGHRITGSDEAFFGYSKEHLRKIGILPDVFGWQPELIHPELNRVLVVGNLPNDNPELQRARDMGVNVQTFAEYLYESSKHKTRVVVSGGPDAAKALRLLMYVLDYWDKQVDYSLEPESPELPAQLHLTDFNDFIVIECGSQADSGVGTPTGYLSLRPNITLLCGDLIAAQNNLPKPVSPGSTMAEFLNTLVPGGSVTYNAENENLSLWVDALTVPVRKFPYHTPTSQKTGEQVRLETPEGVITLRVPEGFPIRNIEGVRWVCQQLGVDAADFYEALSSYQFK